MKKILLLNLLFLLILNSCDSTRGKVTFTLTFQEKTRLTEIQENVKSLNLQGYTSLQGISDAWQFECENNFTGPVVKRIFNHPSQIRFAEVLSIDALFLNLPESYLKYFKPMNNNAPSSLEYGTVEQEYKILIENAFDSLKQTGVEFYYELFWTEPQSDFPLRLHLISLENQIPYGDHITSLFIEKNFNDNACITVQLDEEGQSILNDVTTRYVGRHLAMVINEVVVSVPIINGPISGENMMYCSDNLFDVVFGELFFENVQSGETISVNFTTR